MMHLSTDTAGCIQGVFVVTTLVMRQYYPGLNKKLDFGELPCTPGMEARPEYPRSMDTKSRYLNSSS
ncbi:hypothetical protein F4813DRAFT_351992 [Daldinia decipiens]|uniref:uncharacterized protein n=1 Tax=Daldinia decipiens TaxID=326647 RepID=UPI0020C22B2C|nr:uncharacterized protein F4813DRAFT_351992 [Daldinia decipiens]KAI1659800.1 hypothetical protein F4813DRAFT_351992 [Daldinia decipiens]